MTRNRNANLLAGVVGVVLVVCGFVVDLSAQLPGVDWLSDAAGYAGLVIASLAGWRVPAGDEDGSGANVRHVSVVLLVLLGACTGKQETGPVFGLSAFQVEGAACFDGTYQWTPEGDGSGDYTIDGQLELSMQLDSCAYGMCVPAGIDLQAAGESSDTPDASLKVCLDVADGVIWEDCPIDLH